ncbi:glycoside hydrolase family 6 protein [Lapillicoccus jejuensis]|uniref:Glucanase n=1 Tax=Lapillicoccus jejuensis TaxID=402171 RepID=A0A542DVI6_9MICO|nr:glycoside hydrolase family 6 protein [Lapillicoccus jejuensis]TQJ07110.1 endoglucanase [Lapillicoccus jejuensis]
MSRVLLHRPHRPLARAATVAVLATALGLPFVPSVAAAPTAPRPTAAAAVRATVAVRATAGVRPVAAARTGAGVRSVRGVAVAPAPVRPNPLLGRSLYADSQDWSTTQAMRTGSLSAARLARVPQAKWIGPEDQPAWIADYLGRAQAAGRLPSLVLYAVPGRDCGSYSAGGFTTDAQYLAWVRMVRQTIAGRPTVVVVEPDALAQGSCSGRAADTAARVALLAQAVDILTRDATTAVYLDAGHEWWMSAATAASRLVAAHVQKARGFTLDVSNFYATAGEVAYGQKVVAAVRALVPTADPHFVVDTSRNGNGPAPTGPLDWCNPSGRRLGALPGATTGTPGLDGYLWVKHPGESDGACRPGEPGSGQWYGAWADDVLVRTLLTGAVLP